MFYCVRAYSFQSMSLQRGPGEGGWESHSKREGVLVVPFWCLLGCSASKDPQQKLLQYLGIEPKKYDRRLCVALESVLLGGENIQATPTKQYICLYLLGFFAKFPKGTPVLFIWESSPRPTSSRILRGLSITWSSFY